MKRLLVVMLAVGVAACSKGGSNSGTSGTNSPRGPILGTTLAVQGLTELGQYRPVPHGQPAEAPGMANVWDLDQDFSLYDGGSDQFDGALHLTVGTLTTSPATFNSLLAESLTPFPPTQTTAEVNWVGPTASAADGVVAAGIADANFISARAFFYGNGPSIPLGNAFSATLLPGTDSRLFQTIDLTTAGTNVTLAWTDDVDVYDTFLAGTLAPRYQVVLRSPAGALLTDPPLFEETFASAGTHGLDVSAFRGQRVVLSFELRSDAAAFGPARADLDDVSVSDGTHQFVQNGDFETGTLSGWSTSSAAEPRGLRSGERVLEGLTVTRSFYAPATSLWGRWADLYENKGTNTITTTALYLTDLGSDGSGILYATPGTGGKAVTGWDASDLAARDWDRDLGIVFGSGTGSFQSATGPVPLAAANGSTYVFTLFPLTVAAGHKVTIVHFVILGSQQTMATATSASARATEIDAEAARIVTSFHGDPTLRDGLTQDQLDTLLNF